MGLTMPPRMLVQSEGRFQEQKKLTMVKAQVSLKGEQPETSATVGPLLHGTQSAAYSIQVPAIVTTESANAYSSRSIRLRSTRYLQRPSSERANQCANS
jgi:hypothetical protein